MDNPSPQDNGSQPLVATENARSRWAEKLASEVDITILGAPILAYEEVTSTSDVLKELALAGAPEGLVSGVCQRAAPLARKLASSMCAGGRSLLFLAETRSGPGSK